MFKKLFEPPSMWEETTYAFDQSEKKLSLQQKILNFYRENGLGPGGSLIHTVNSHYLRSRSFLSEFGQEWPWIKLVSKEEIDWMQVWIDMGASNARLIETGPAEACGGKIINDSLSPGCSVYPDEYWFYAKKPIRAFKDNAGEFMLEPGLYGAKHRNIILFDEYEAVTKIVTLQGPPSRCGVSDSVVTDERILMAMFRDRFATPVLVTFQSMITHKLNSFSLVSTPSDLQKYIDSVKKGSPVERDWRLAKEIKNAWLYGGVANKMQAYLWSSWLFHPELGTRRHSQIYQELRTHAIKLAQ